MDNKKDENKKNVYIDEHIILNNSEKILKNRLIPEAELWNEYENLHSNYKRLLCEAEGIIRIGDLYQKKLYSENIDLKKIIKFKVANGMYWIEIPMVNLRILCGCPANSVKILIKRGLINKREENQVVYESGPNAILLSDAAIQNETFSNLAEFPILQMLYKQGMGIPDHPNNRGIKPILIGIKDIVESQGNYFYRGNYGLSTIEELRKAGISKNIAGELMRMKLKFAFGKIMDIEDLIQLKIVESEPVELRDKVFVQRTGFNKYKFTWNNNEVTVDLNLKPNEKYESPYSLGMHDIKREYFSIIHTGEGDGWDVKRPCISSIITFQGKIYLIDTGPNILESLTALGISVNEIEGIFHTHAHDDHFAGLTTLIRSDHLIKYYTTPLIRTSVIKKLSALTGLDEKAFGRYFKIRDLEFDTWHNIDGLEVKPVLSPHPVETNIFFFRTYWKDGYKTYAHVTDTTNFGILEKMISEDENEYGISREMFEKVKQSYLTPVDIKKLDIGGGIHGIAEDFKHDKSKKILLGHTEHDLTNTQKEIGSNAHFGMQDILIPSQQNYAMSIAHHYLSTYFPSVPRHIFKLLLNYPLISFNPGTILLTNDTKIDHIFLIISGVIELINTKTNRNYELSTGSIIGEIPCLTNNKPIGTYRTVSYVKALCIPRSQYLRFTKQYNLHDRIVSMHKNREFLQNTWLLGEMVSYPILNKIAAHLSNRTLLKRKLDQNTDKQNLVFFREGEIQLCTGEYVIETLSKGNFFGEDNVLSTPQKYNVVVKKESTVFVSPAHVLKDIPIVQLKLMEVHTKRLRAVPMTG